jgi:deoxyguanosine kinase
MGVTISMNSFRYIAVEGVIGAGKTTLARLLSEHQQARLVLEEFEDNPFLPHFYQDRARYAFQTQLSFLATRFHQQGRLSNPDLFHPLTIADYMFEKDRIFASINLSADELGLYDRIFKIMQVQAIKPDLVVYLQCGLERLLFNIAQRGRSYENEMDPQYLKLLIESYNQFFLRYDQSPLIIINANDMDFVKNQEHFHYINDHIFRNPIGSSPVYLTQSPV